MVRDHPVRFDASADPLETAPCGFLAFGDDGIVRRVNATLLEMLGRERDDLVGLHVEQILSVGSRIFYQTHWFPLLRMHGRAEEIFLLLRASSGEDIGVLVNAVRRETADGALFDCVLLRVRERKKFEDELVRARRAAEQARAVSEAGRRELELANQRLREQALELEQRQWMLEEQAAELETAGEELRTINEELLRRTVEAESLREVAEEANKAKSTFLAMMSHELRTPLNAIAGYADLLEMQIHGPLTESQQASLERIRKSGLHLLRLINEILNLSRIEAGQVDYHPEDVPVAELVRIIVPMVEPQLERKGISLSIDLPPDLVVRVDRDKAEQILLNLLGNAAKFTPDGGQVTVRAIRDPGPADRACIRVGDTGIGIPPDKMDVIFHPFVQVDATASRAAEGSGLGLAISRDLARGMAGDITVESVLGEGSTFTLTLPLAP
jgi:signal transduction histidine kinase